MYTPTKPLKTLWTFWWTEGGCCSMSSDVRAKLCVPKVCQISKTRLNSATLRSFKDRRKTLIQRIFKQEGHPRAMSGKDGKNGFVISRSPVRSRRVAPVICPRIMQFLADCRMSLPTSCLELAHKLAHKNVLQMAMSKEMGLENGHENQP